MTQFTAEMEYEVLHNGRAKVTEIRTVENKKESSVSFKKYQEVLPLSVDCSSIICKIIHEKDEKTLSYLVEDCEGTDRKMFRVPRNEEDSIVCKHGKTQLKTEYDITSFYSHFNVKNCYMFSFHHSLPPLEYLKDSLVHKRISIRIEKPANRFIWKWSMLCSSKPESGSEEFLENYSKTIPLNFVFSLSQTHHYYTTVVLRKHLRFNFFKVIPFLMKLWFKSKGV